VETDEKPDEKLDEKPVEKDEKPDVQTNYGQKLRCPSCGALNKPDAWHCTMCQCMFRDANARARSLSDMNPCDNPMAAPDLGGDFGSPSNPVAAWRRYKWAIIGVAGVVLVLIFLIVK
jgi:uncharacterized membrane protein YvbJ